MSVDNRSYVYTITNLITHEIYVGKTNDPARRWMMHKYFSKRKNVKFRSHLYASMRKYGIETFHFEVIAESPSEIAALECERIVIHQLKLSGVQLLNNTLGGDGVRLDKLSVIRVEQSERMKRLWADPVFRQDIQERQRHVIHEPHTQSTRDKISQSVKLFQTNNPDIDQIRKAHAVEKLRTPEIRERISKSQKIAQNSPDVKQKIIQTRLHNELNDEVFVRIAKSIISEYDPYRVSMGFLAQKYGLSVTQIKRILRGSIRSELEKLNKS